MSRAEDYDNTRSTWTREAFLAAADTWIGQAVEALDLGPVLSVQLVQARPWGVLRLVRTAERELYWKATPTHSPELRLTVALAELQPGATPAVVAVDATRGWWLMADAGQAFAPHEPAQWSSALAAYGELQRRLETEVATLEQAGVPRYPLLSLSAELDRLLADRRLLRVGQEGGLTLQEHADLVALQPAFAHWCAEADDYDLPLTVQHDDLSSANIRRSAASYAYIDWADAHLAHPFGSLLFPERELGEGFGGGGAADVGPWVRPYLEWWSDLLDLDDLTRLRELVLRVALVPRALSWSRALTQQDRGALPANYAAPEARWLRRLLVT